MEREKIINSFLWKLLERFTSQTVSLLVTILLARMLMPDEYGIVAIVLVFVNIANVIVDGGLNTALVQKKQADNVDFSTIFFFCMVLAGLFYLLLFLAAPWMAAFYGKSILSPVVRVLSLNLFFFAFNSIQVAYISRHMLFNRLFYCTLSATLVSGVAGLLAAFNGWGVWALVVQQIANQVTLSMTMWTKVRWRPIRTFSVGRFKGLFDYGWKIFLTNFIIVVYEDIRGLVIGKVYKPAMLAYFDRGKQFPNLVTNNISISLQTILLPVLADIQDDHERVRQMLRHTICVTNFFVLPLLTALLVMAKPFVVLLLTDKWVGAVPFLQIFCLAFMMMPIQSANMSAIKALGYSRITLNLEVIKKILETVILVVSFMIGVYAVAWGVVIYNILCLGINLYPCRKLLGYGIVAQFRDVLPSFLISVVMGMAMYGLSTFPIPTAMQLAVQTSVGMVAYIVLHTICRTKSMEYVRTVARQWLKRERK